MGAKGKQLTLQRYVTIISGFSLWLLLSGCSPGYVVQAAYEQGKILLARRPILDVIEDADTSQQDREKLKLVLEARALAGRIGLDPQASFTSYADIGKESLAWVVVGSRKDSFALYTWWFPIVGRVPYKGFFDKADAETEAAGLEHEGYETWVRDTDAFSTLGWFDDPILSTTLKSGPTRIVNTVLHESVHSTVWIQNNVAFNESLANFVGTQATIDFFRERVERCGGVEGTCESARAALQLVVAERERQDELAEVLATLYGALDALYRDPILSAEQKIAQRTLVFEQIVGPLRARYPKMTILKSVHNAEIIQLKLYNTDLKSFSALFQKVGRNWTDFLKAVYEIRDAVDKDAGIDPFLRLHIILGEQ